MVTRKSRAEIERMRRAGRIVAEVLALVEEELKPGVSTGHLDRLAEAHIRKAGATPSFKGYPGINPRRPFPASLCISIGKGADSGWLCGAAFSGSLRKNSAPSPSPLTTPTSPPMRLASSRQVASPMPMPCTVRLFALLPLSNIEKRTCLSASEIPGP